MNPWTRRFTWFAFGAAALTGVAYGWMKYFLKGPDEFAVVHHPLQPAMLKLHLITAPFLVFALGLLAAVHVGRHVAAGTRAGRRSGLGASALGIVMVLSGYAVQIMTGERAIRWIGWGHTGVGVACAMCFLLHQLATRRERARRQAGVIAVAMLVGMLALEGPQHESQGVAAPSSEGGAVEVERAWPVMGTVFQACLTVPDSADGETALAASRDRVFRVDSLMSTYREESELSRVNRNAGPGRAESISPETAAVLEAALAMGRESAGAFDVTVGPLVACWDFFRDHQGEDMPPPDEAAIRAALTRVGQDKIRYDRASRTLALEVSGMQLDFGAIAKGYALDLAMEAARGAGASAGLLDLGGQVLCFGTPPEGGPWRLAVRNPRDPDASAAVVAIESGSLSTSGDYERFFRWNGKRYAPLFDPRSGWPVCGTAAVTVWAPSGMLADAWSTALFVTEREKRAGIVARHPELGVIWFDDPGSGELAPALAHVDGALAGRTTIVLP